MGPSECHVPVFVGATRGHQIEGRPRGPAGRPSLARRRVLNRLLGMRRTIFRLPSAVCTSTGIPWESITIRSIRKLTMPIDRKGELRNVHEQPFTNTLRKGSSTSARRACKREGAQGKDTEMFQRAKQDVSVDLT